MLKFYSVIIFSCLFHGLTVCVESETKEKVYYKQTTSTAAVEANGPIPKNEIPVVMEGQPPLSESVTSNTAKINSLKTIVKKESKTVPRKGVLNKSSEKIDQNDNLHLNSSLETPIVEKLNTSSVILEPNKQIIANSSTISNSTEKSMTPHVAPVREVLPLQDKMNDAVTTKPVRKPKPKPQVTIGGKEADEPIPASPTNKSPLGMPRKIDYIVPVVITITALPLLGVAFYVLYKRGRDYWDKRHYRRMDFLIDGMYNE